MKLNCSMRKENAPAYVKPERSFYFGETLNFRISEINDRELRPLGFRNLYDAPATALPLLGRRR